MADVACLPAASPKAPGLSPQTVQLTPLCSSVYWCARHPSHQEKQRLVDGNGMLFPLQELWWKYLPILSAANKRCDLSLVFHAGHCYLLRSLFIQGPTRHKYNGQSSFIYVYNQKWSDVVFSDCIGDA